MKSNPDIAKNVKSYFRVFPMEKMTWDYVKILEDRKTIYIRSLQGLSKAKRDTVPTFWTFPTDHVFYNTTQKEIFETIMCDVFDNVIKGKDGIIMAYGQTGAGKTSSITGLNFSYEDRGILPRIIPELFQALKAIVRDGVKMCVQVSYVEFAKTNMFDLLKQCPNSFSQIKDITKVKVKTVSEALKLLFMAEGRRETTTKPAYYSHTSSSVFTFYITTKNTELCNPCLEQRKIHVIDLAGADTVGNLSCLFKDPLDVGSGNLTKSQLEQFILALCTQMPNYIRVKHRLSPMMQFLGSSLNTNTTMRIIGHIKISREDLMITISMLRFGQLISGVRPFKCECRETEEVSLEKIHMLEKQLSKIKTENAYNEILLNQDLGKYLNEERLNHVERTVEEYLQDKIKTITLLNVCDINAALEVTKKICRKYEEERKEPSLLTSPSSVKAKRSSSSKLSRNRSAQATSKTLLESGSKKLSFDKVSSEKSRGSLKKAGSSVHSPKRPSSIHQEVHKMRSRPSSASLLRRVSSTKKRTSSSASVLIERRESRKSTKSESVLLPEMAPEFKEVWNLYMEECQETYKNFTDFYQENEKNAKEVYKTYLEEVDKLRQANSAVDKRRNEVLLARFTENYKNEDYKESGEESELERTCKQMLEKAQEYQLEMQEAVLKCQTELKIYLNLCNEIKRDLKVSFDEFCQGKYQQPVENLDEEVVKSIEDVLEEEMREEVKEEEEVEVREVALDLSPEVKATEQFEKFKRLIEVERRRKEIYKACRRDWIPH